MEQHPSPRSAQRKRMDGERRSPSQWDEDDREARVHAAWCCHNSAQARARSRHHSRRSSSEITTRKITVLKLKCFCPHGASDLRAQNRGSTPRMARVTCALRTAGQHVISTKGGCRSSRRSKSGRRGIRTPEGETSRFTVCSRWPLEYPPSGSRVGRGAEIVQRVGGCRKRFCEFVHGLIGDCLRNRNACARARQIINGSGPVIGPASLPVW